MKERKGGGRIEKREADSRKVLRRLRAAGCPVPVDEDESSPPRDLTIKVCNPEQTRAYDFRVNAEFVFAVRITNHSYARLYGEKFKCRLPWPVPNPTWLGDPRIHSPGTEEYRLPSGRIFPYNTVLNHCVGELGKLEPQDTREGVLLAFSVCRGIPAEYLHGSTFAAELSVLDQYGRCHRSFIEMVVDRTATIDFDKVKHRSGKGLYDNDSENADAPPATPQADRAWFNTLAIPAVAQHKIFRNARKN